MSKYKFEVGQNVMVLSEFLVPKFSVGKVVSRYTEKRTDILLKGIDVNFYEVEFDGKVTVDYMEASLTHATPLARAIYET